MKYRDIGKEWLNLDMICLLFSFSNFATKGGPGGSKPRTQVKGLWYLDIPIASWTIDWPFFRHKKTVSGDGVPPVFLRLLRLLIFYFSTINIGVKLFFKTMTTMLLKLTHITKSPANARQLVIFVGLHASAQPTVLCCRAKSPTGHN